MRRNGIGQGWLDGLSIGASALCLIHCLALPILIAALPALARALDLREGFHLLVLAAAIPTSAVALMAGHRRHGALVPVFTGIAGLVLMMIGALFTSRAAAETALTVAGSLLLASAHIANWRLRARVTG
ncbi:MAG: MerC domain-containing protein [Sphingobium sp.]